MTHFSGKSADTCRDSDTEPWVSTNPGSNLKTHLQCQLLLDSTVTEKFTQEIGSVALAKHLTWLLFNEYSTLYRSHIAVDITKSDMFSG